VKNVHFNAPWGTPLVVMTIVCLVICIGTSVPGVMLAIGNNAILRAMGVRTFPVILQWSGWFMVVVLLLTILLSAVYMVRGYALTEDFLIVKRLGWDSRVSLARLMSAAADPNAVHGSFRIFGNGGCFSFVGWYRNKTLGTYRAYATDVKRSVVLRFSDKTIVVTPDDPQKFVAEITPSIWKPS